MTIHSRRRGFALLTVLWLIVLLAAVTSGTILAVQRGQRFSTNRMMLTRARWAGDACLAMLQARGAEHPGTRVVDSTALGRGVWCRVTVTDLASRVNLNRADGTILRATLGSDSLTAALLDWRDPDSVESVGGAEHAWYTSHQRDGPQDGPFGSVAELRLVRGFEKARQELLDSLFTVEGDGRINPNLVPRRLLAALPGLDAQAVHEVGVGTPVGSLDDLAARLTGSSRRTLVSAYRELNGLLAFQPAWLEARVEGGVRNSPVRSVERVLMVPLESRLAIISRQPW